MVTVYIYRLYMRGPKKKSGGGGWGGQSDSCVCHGGPRHHIFGSLKFKKLKFSGPLEPPPPIPLYLRMARVKWRIHGIGKLNKPALKQKWRIKLLS